MDVISNTEDKYAWDKRSVAEDAYHSLCILLRPTYILISFFGRRVFSTSAFIRRSKNGRSTYAKSGKSKKTISLEKGFTPTLTEIGLKFILRWFSTYSVKTFDQLLITQAVVCIKPGVKVLREEKSSKLAQECKVLFFKMKNYNHISDITCKHITM